MSFSRYPFERKPQAGYFGLLGGFRGLGLYLLLAVAYVTSIVGFDPSDALSFLSFPLVLGLSIIIGIIFRYSGAMASIAIVLIVGLVLRSIDVGIFENMSAQQGIFFVFGNTLTTGLFSTISALAFGYNLRRSELATNRQNLLHKVFDALPIGIWVRARDGRSIFVNDRWAEFSPFSAAEIVDSGRIESPVDLGNNWEQRLDEIIDSDNSAVHYENIELKNGKGDSALMTLLTLRMFIDQENDFGSLSLLIDETALRAYEAKIRQSEQNLQLALHNAKMGFWTEDIKTKEVHCDDNWYGLLNARPSLDKSPIKVWRARLHAEDRERVRQTYRAFYASGSETTRLDYRIRKGDEGYIWVQDSILVTERFDDGSACSIMGTTQDISEQKEAELELTLAKEKAETANQAKGQFIATISHEIRTPLNAILGLSSFLAESDLDEEHLDLAQTIHSSGENLLTLVNEILDFSKIEAGQLRLDMQEFPLVLCLEESIKLFKLRAAEKKVGFRLEAHQSLPEFVFGDMERLRQILQNLLSNALKFTDEGDVTVFARAVAVDDFYLNHCSSSNRQKLEAGELGKELLEVRVKDSGIGIPKERQHMLFQAFSQIDASTTRKYGGTGLGLVICKRLIDAMGGCIWVESDYGKGAEFCFVAPIKLFPGKSHSPVPRPLADQPNSGAKVKMVVQHPLDILVIGPDESTAELLQTCRSLGYAPHHSVDYDLGESAFGHRNYNLVLVALDKDLQALELVRRVSAGSYAMRPESIIGFGPAEQDFSLERCRLSGFGQVLPEAPCKEKLRAMIMDVVGARG